MQKSPHVLLLLLYFTPKVKLYKRNADNRRKKKIKLKVFKNKFKM